MDPDRYDATLGRLDDMKLMTMLILASLALSGWYLHIPGVIPRSSLRSVQVWCERDPGRTPGPSFGHPAARDKERSG
jgi:hypothetical protein